MDQLNEDVLYLIFAELGLLDKVRLERVCRRWHFMLQQPRAHINTRRLNAAAALFKQTPQIDSHRFESLMVGALKRCGSNLVELTFGGDNWFPITQNIIDAIAVYCPRLIKIDMSCTRISGDMSSLMDRLSSQLIEFSVEEASWIDGAYLQLNQMHCLERINLRKCPGPLHALGSMPSGQLRSADLSATLCLTPQALIQFLHSHHNQQLRELILCPFPRSCQLLNTLQSIIDAIGTVNTLDTLSIGYIKGGSGITLNPLSTLTQLKSLYIKECPFLTAEQLLAILRCCSSQLRDITLSDCRQLKDYAPIAHCHRLRAVQVERSDYFSDTHLTLLSEYCPLLRRLQIDRCYRVTDTGVNVALRKWKDIRELEISNCDGIGGDQLFSIANNNDTWSDLHCLQTLSLNGTKAITNDSLKELAQTEEAIKHLRELDLSHNMNVDNSAIIFLHSQLRRMGRAAHKPLLVYAFQTGVTHDIADTIQPEIELLF